MKDLGTPIDGASIRCEGTITGFRFQRDGFAIFLFEDMSRNQTSCKGHIPTGLSAGDVIEIVGKWVEHDRFGFQIDLNHVIPKTPLKMSDDATEKVLCMLPQIDTQRAQWMIARWGADRVFDVIDKTPNLLLEVPGITGERLKAILEEWAVISEVRDVYRYFAELQIPTKTVNKMIDMFGAGEALRLTKEDPYKLSRVPSLNLSFKECDRIGTLQGIEEDDHRRMKGGIVHVITEYVNKDGHMYMQESRLDEAFCRDVYRGGYTENDVCDLMDDGEIVVVEGRVGSKRDDFFYLRQFYVHERVIADLLLELSQAPVEVLPVDEESEGFKALVPGQQEAVKLFAENRVMILTGGPGTGKTFVMKYIIEVLGFRSVALAAPTGRAAKRITELSGRPASTVHRLLCYNGERFLVDEIDEELVVLDEASMLDSWLAWETIRRVRPASRLLIIGDPDQLPSVGPGEVLNDIIASGVVPVARLSQIMRQAEGNPVIEAAHDILHGSSPKSNKLDGKIQRQDDMIMFPVGSLDASKLSEDEASIKSGILEVLEYLKSLGWNLDTEVQVLCPQKTREVGTVALNSMLQEFLNKQGFQGSMIQHGDRYFLKGDRVIHIKNNYDPVDVSHLYEGTGPRGQVESSKTDPVFNGEIGTILNVEKGRTVTNGKTRKYEIVDVNYDGRVIRYESQDLGMLLHAYAITVHKSQGSEFPVVVIPVHMANRYMLQRRLLYTGVTRAKNVCVLVGQKSAVRYAVNRPGVGLRATALSDMLRGETEKPLNGFEPSPYEYRIVRDDDDDCCGEESPEVSTAPLDEPVVVGVVTEFLGALDEAHRGTSGDVVAEVDEDLDIVLERLAAIEADSPLVEGEELGDDLREVEEGPSTPPVSSTFCSSCGQTLESPNAASDGMSWFCSGCQ